MADTTFTFTPEFKEFLPIYRDVTRVWIGDGATTGDSGMLYAEYANGEISELGFVTLYEIAVQHGYQGTVNDWTQAIISLAAMNKGATTVTVYRNSNTGVEHPAASAEWSPTPTPTKGEYLWAKTTITWVDSTTSVFYSVSYQGQDSALTSVNGETGNVFLHGDKIVISANDNQTIKHYIDTMTYTPEIATEAQIRALFEEQTEEEPV